MPETTTDRRGARRRPLTILLSALLLAAAALVASVMAPAGAQPAPDLSAAVWPPASNDMRFAEPETAAASFATEYLGMDAPVLGPFLPGDAQSGEIVIDAPGTGRDTTILLRRLGDVGWFVIGSVSEAIEVDTPTALDIIDSPVAVAGRSVAFEATVPVEVRQDGGTTPLGTGIVMGGAGPTLEPFSGSIAFTGPTTAYGAVVLLDVSAADGDVEGATVVRVQFADPTPPTTSTTAPPTTPTTTPAAPTPAVPVPARPTFTG